MITQLIFKVIIVFLSILGGARASQSFTVSPTSLSLPSSVSASLLPSIGSVHTLSTVSVLFNYTDTSPSNISHYIICGNNSVPFLGNGNIQTGNPDYNFQLFVGSKQITSCAGTNSASQFYGPQAGSNINVSLSVVIQLVRTGNTSNATPLTFPSSIAFCAQHTNTTSCIMPVSFQVLGSTSILLPTCSVSTPSVAVNLGSVNINTFTGIGSTSGNAPFSIQLNCPSTVPVKMRIAATTVSGNPNIMALSTGGSPAGNMGVQLLFNSSPFPLNANTSVGTSSVGIFTIPLMARYYQTSAPVTAGQGNASATFTMTYN